MRRRFFAAVRGQLERCGLLSDEHFTVDGTMLEAWANRRSFHPKAEPPERGSGRGGKRLLRDTHESHTDPEARLYRKCNAGAAEPSYLGHVLTENTHGLIVGGMRELKPGRGPNARRRCGLLDEAGGKGPRRSLGADKQYQEPRVCGRHCDNVRLCRTWQSTKGGSLRVRNSLREEERASAGFVQSQRKRKLVEQSFAWIKQWAGLRQVKLRSRRRVEWLFQLAAAAYNLVRMTRLIVPAN